MSVSDPVSDLASPAVSDAASHAASASVELLLDSSLDGAPISVRSERYDGPLRVLITEVAARRIDVCDLALADVIVAFSRSALAADAHRAAEFLVLAATLVELKTRRLLPDENVDDLEAELWAYTQADVRLARSIERRTFARASALLRSLLAESSQHHLRVVGAGADERLAQPSHDPLASHSPDELASALARALEPKPTIEFSTAHITPIRVTVEECVERLEIDLPGLAPLAFRDLVAGFDDPHVTVAYFLALLELFRLGSVGLAQAELFGEIEITWLGEPAARLAPRSVAA